MNIPVFIDLVRNMLKEKSLLLEADFNTGSLSISETGIKYSDYAAEKIIFCEGHLSSANSLWGWLPFVPAKGEILTIRCTELPEDFILLSGIFIVPIGDKKFRVGSTYEWNYESEAPTEEAKNKLINLLDSFLKVSYEIIDHRAGIRPTVKDRRPFVGRHPAHQNVYIFNGMGTKGVQLAPYFADRLIDHIEKKEPLPDEVDIRRWIPPTSHYVPGR
jgi:glycine/D-amino acid oxidase-like deaminating enzyme